MKAFIKTLGLATAFAFAIFAQQLRAQDNNDAQAPPDNGYVNSQPDVNNAPNSNAVQQNGDNSVSFQTFYDQLAGQGSWINTDQYGYVFQPTESDPNWRPYTYGHWVNTDAGMTWVSDESFGWATYHYGRWANIDGIGWVWVPGYTWAPAWVSWRDGDDEVGWAPLPPDSDQGIDYYSDDDYYTDPGYFGFHIGDDCDLVYGIGPLWYNFCPVAFIGDRDCWRHFSDHNDNFAFIGRTRNVTNINFRRDGVGRFGNVRAEGPNVASLNTRSRTPIERAQLASVSRAGDAGLRGNRLGVFAPRVDPSTFHTARPASISRTLANVNVNRGTDISRPLAVNSRIAPAAATSGQIHAASLAQANISANARIATANTHISRPLTQPLSSLRTTTRSAATAGTAFRPNNVAGVNRQVTPSASIDSRYTGQPTIPHGTMSSDRESRIGGESAYTGEGFRSQAVAPGRAYHPSNAFHATTPNFGAQPSFQRSAPAFHPQRSFQSSAPAFHPQQSFHSFAPAPTPHFSGGGFRGGGAPAAHFSGGGGGHVSGGGGGHASTGGQVGHR